MGPSRPQPTEEEWIHCKLAIRRMYLVDHISLKELAEKVGNLGFYVTKAQLEYKLKQWGFRRNLDKASWASIGRKITKRKAEGKDSQVILCGKRLKMSTVEKGTNRHRDNSIWAKLAPARSPSPTTDNQVIVCTPQPLPMEVTWPSNLPWLKFQDKHLQMLTNLGVEKAGRQECKASQLLRRTQRACSIAALVVPDRQLWWNGSPNNVPKLASTIGISMPESYPGEHLQRAQILLSGSEQEMHRESLAVLIHQVSNSLIDLTSDATWDATIKLLRQCGMFDPWGDFLRFQGKTIRAFMHNLFTAAMLWAGRHDGSMDVVKWLLSSGQNPNACIRADEDLAIQPLVTPLQQAASSGEGDLVDVLLAAGADANLMPPNDQLGPPLELAVRGYSEQRSLRMVKSLLRYGASVNLDQALLQSTSWKVIEVIVQGGGNLSAVLKPKTGPVCEETVLSRATEWGEWELQLGLDLHKLQYALRPVGDFITADVFVAAAAEGEDDSIRALSNISSAGSLANSFGITPLHAAAMNGHGSTCQLLLELYGFPSSGMGYLSPMHLAGYGGHSDVLQLLLDHGADVNTISAIGGQPHPYTERCFPAAKGLSDLEHAPVRHMTLLSILLELALKASFPRDSNLCDCAAVLVQVGAQLSGQEVITAARARSYGLLSAALVAGSSPNSKSENGLSALQIVVETARVDPWFWSEAATLLLARGATLSGGEVITTICHGQWELAQIFLRNGANLMETGDSGMTALEAAILAHQNQDDFDEMLEALLARGHYDAGSLCAAVASGGLWLVNQLLHNRPAGAQLDILETTAIGMAANQENIKVLQKLLEYLPQSNAALLPNQETAIDWCYLPPRLWREKYFRGSLLALAASSSSVIAFRELLQHGYRPDRRTWIKIAARNSLELAETLVSHGKRVSDDGYPAERSEPLPSPLIEAISHQNKELVLLLLKAGAEVDEHDVSIPFSRCPLQCAIETGDLGIVDVLLEAGADVNSPPASSGGATALQLAAIKGYMGLARLLLGRGASIDAPRARTEGRTALEGAAEHGRLDMLQLLLSHGAQTTGDGQHQYLRSVKRAGDSAYHASVDLLQSCREWSEEDHRLFIDKDLLEDWYELSNAGEDEQSSENGEESEGEDFSEGESRAKAKM